jgi:hypothetical protein
MRVSPWPAFFMFLTGVLTQRKAWEARLKHIWMEIENFEKDPLDLNGSSSHATRWSTDGWGSDAPFSITQFLESERAARDDQLPDADRPWLRVEGFGQSCTAEEACDEDSERLRRFKQWPQNV